MRDSDLKALEEYLSSIPRLPKMNFLTTSQNFFLGETGDNPDILLIMREMREMQALAKDLLADPHPNSKIHLRVKQFLGVEDNEE